MKTNRERAIKIVMTYHDIPQLMEWIEIALDKMYRKGIKYGRRKKREKRYRLVEDKTRVCWFTDDGIVCKPKPPFNVEKVKRLLVRYHNTCYHKGYYSKAKDNENRTHYAMQEINVLSELYQELGIEDE